MTKKSESEILCITFDKRAKRQRCLFINCT